MGDGSQKERTRKAKAPEGSAECDDLVDCPAVWHMVSVALKGSPLEGELSFRQVCGCVGLQA